MRRETNRSFSAVPHPPYPVKPLLLSLVFILLPLSAATRAQQPSRDPHAGLEPIRSYISAGWDTLSRSLSDCATFSDPKLATAPHLYLPADFPLPAAVQQLETRCHVQVKTLPSSADHLGKTGAEATNPPGLLYLPNPYVVPGGRFNEMYGWDSYFIILGLVEDKRTDLARDVVENFFFEIENYGAILNANRTYYFTRSQPPFLTSMIREVYEHQTGKPLSKAWLAKAYSYAQRDYALWSAPPHLAGDTGLARYDDIGEGPVPEMADDSNYYPDVIRWLLAHPEIHTDYLIDAPDNPTPEQAAELAKISCDITVSKVCANAHVNGHRLSSDFY